MRVTHRHAKLAGIVLLALVALYAAAGFLLSPWLVQRYLPGFLEQKLERQVSIGTVRINPFLLTLEMRDVSVAGRHGSPVLSAGRVFADLAFAGLFRRTWTVDELRLEALHAHAVLERDGSLNLLELARSFGSGDAAPATSRPALVVNELVVPAARVAFTDLTGQAPARVVVEPVTLHAAQLSTFDNQAATHELTAQLPAGGQLRWRGELGLYPALTASGEASVQGLAANTLWPFVRDELLLSEFQATASASTRYAFDAQQSLRLNGMTLDLGGVRLARRGGQGRLLEMKKIALAGGSVDFAQHHVSADSLDFQSGQAAVTVSPDGSIDWASLLAPPQGAAQAEAAGTEPAKGTQDAARAAAKAPDAADWTFDIAALHTDQVGLRYTDRSREQPLSVEASAVSAELGLSISGGASPRVLAQGLAARLHDVVLAAPGAAEPAASLRSVAVEQGRFDLRDKFVGAQRLSVDGGKLAVVRRQDGELPLLQLLGLADEGSSGPRTRAAAASTTAGNWQYDIDALGLQNVDIALADRAFQPALSLGGTLRASVKNLGPDQRASFDAAFAVNGGGTIRSKGTVALAGPVFDARVEVKDVLLKPLQPLIQRFAAVRVQSGAVSASAAVRSGGAAGALRSDGSFRIADLLVDEAPSGDRLLAWKLLEADRFDFDLAARQLAVKQLTVQEPGAKIVVSRDRKLNLSQLLKPAGSGGGPGGDAPVRQAAGDARQGGFDFVVERVRLRNGDVDFADLSLVLPFSTRVTQIEGTIVGISSDPSRRADVKASGDIQPYGAAQVEGSFVPAQPEQFTNLHVQFDNVLVPPLSPYTATFAGRKVQSGKLWLDLEYKVQDGQLLGKNDIRLADFTLGEKVEAPNAMDVPLNLAVALLTDADGQIRLSVPVRGDLDHPHFSVGSAVRQAIGNAIRRIATAPFRALARLFGGSADSLAKVEFEPGSAALQPEQRERLDKLGRALAQRPQVQLVVTAPYDPDADARVLQRRQARSELARALGRDLRPGEDPGPIAYDDPATRRALQQLLQRQAGAAGVRELRSGSGDAAAQRESYEAMFDKLAAAQPLRASSVQVLATERARTITNYLREQGVAAARVQTGRLSAVDTGQDGAVAAQLSLASAATGR